jgi:Sigma-70 region 2
MKSSLEMTVGAPQGDASDHLLLSRYTRSRDPETFLELVRRHTGLVYGTCLRITANVHDAEELTQECFFGLSLTRHQDSVIDASFCLKYSSLKLGLPFSGLWPTMPPLQARHPARRNAADGRLTDRGRGLTAI